MVCRSGSSGDGGVGGRHSSGGNTHSYRSFVPILRKIGTSPTGARSVALLRGSGSWSSSLVVNSWSSSWSGIRGRWPSAPWSACTLHSGESQAGRSKPLHFPALIAQIKPSHPRPATISVPPFIPVESGCYNQRGRYDGSVVADGTIVAKRGILDGGSAGGSLGRGLREAATAGSGRYRGCGRRGAGRAALPDQAPADASGTADAVPHPVRPRGAEAELWFHEVGGLSGLLLFVGVRGGSCFSEKLIFSENWFEVYQRLPIRV